MISIVRGSSEEAWASVNHIGVLAKLVTAIWKGHLLPPGYGHLHQVLKGATKLESQRIKDQLSSACFPAAGGVCTLNLLLESSNQQQIIQNQLARVSLRQVMNPMKLGSLANEIFDYLKKCGAFEPLPGRISKFCMDTDGLLKSSNQFALYLLKVRHLPEKTGSAKEHYVVAKLPKTSSSIESLSVEHQILLALQATQRVPHLWNGSGQTMQLRKTGLLTDYHPVSLEWSSLLWLSLEEVIALAVEILRALQAVHAEGYAMLNLNPSHLLFTALKADPRDRTEPLRITGCRKAHFIQEISPDSDNFKEMRAGSASWLSPEIIAGNTVSEKSDIYSAGLIIFSCLQREICSDINQNADIFDPVKMSERFNRNVYGRSTTITENHFLVPLLKAMLSKDPADRPSAATAVSMCDTPPALLEELALGNVQSYPIHGHLDKVSGHFVWPIQLTATVIQDPHNRSRLAVDISGVSLLQAPKGSIMAVYTGRPVSKRELFWMQHIGLATHAISDGYLWGLDGRRLCNGIFNTDYFLETRKVTTKDQYLGLNPGFHASMTHFHFLLFYVKND